MMFRSSPVSKEIPVEMTDVVVNYINKGYIVQSFTQMFVWAYG